MSDKWKVDYSDKALLDLQVLHDHIAFNFTILRIMYGNRDVDTQLNAGS